MDKLYGPCHTHCPLEGRQIHLHMCIELIKVVKCLEQEKSPGTVDEMGSCHGRRL